MQHQKNTATAYNRYPDIFKDTISLVMNRPVAAVLSFGCSYGDEIATIKDLYHRESQVDGVDILESCINECRSKFQSSLILDYSEFITRNERYDVIFAMSVLCRWEETETVDNCSDIYPFEFFEKAIGILVSKLRYGGLLVVYNANFRVSDTIYSDILDPVKSYMDGSGFVHKFDKENNKINSVYQEVIFRKIA